MVVTPQAEEMENKMTENGLVEAKQWILGMSFNFQCKPVLSSLVTNTVIERIVVLSVNESTRKVITSRILGISQCYKFHISVTFSFTGNGSDFECFNRTHCTFTCLTVIYEYNINNIMDQGCFNRISSTI